MKIDTSKTAPENCAYFDKCNVNACPLHKDYLKLVDTAEDKLLPGLRMWRMKRSMEMKKEFAFIGEDSQENASGSVLGGGKE